MLRKHIISAGHAPTPGPDEPSIDIPAVTTVMLTSEAPSHPIDHAFDGHRGPGATRWVAAETGEQTIILAFDAPQTLRQVIVEIEETQTARTQELQLALSCDGGRSYREILRQEYTFSPPGTTFEREEWTASSAGVSHLRLWIKPDKSGDAGRATLTSLVLR